ncbi:MAG: DUF896 domain-containing protein [Faecalibacterium sp.]
MIQEKVDRINVLARKSKTEEGLSEAEKAEQQALRAEYIADFRRSFRAQLDNIDVEDADGNVRPLTPKTKTPRS